MNRRPKSTLAAVALATPRATDVSVGEPGWRDRLYQSLADRTWRERAVNGAKLGVGVALMPVAINALAKQKLVSRLQPLGPQQRRKYRIREAVSDLGKGLGMAVLGAGAGAVGGLVGGPAGSALAAGALAHLTVPSTRERLREWARD
jgi:hypothetical protein